MNGECALGPYTELVVRFQVLFKIAKEVSLRPCMEG